MSIVGSEEAELLREIAASLKRIETLLPPMYLVDPWKVNLDDLIELDPGDELRVDRTPGRIVRLKPGAVSVDVRDVDRTADFAWIKANAANYRGNWVALKGGELLACSKVLKEVMDALGDDPPKALIHRIPDKEGGPFATDSGLYEW